MGLFLVTFVVLFARTKAVPKGKLKGSGDPKL